VGDALGEQTREERIGPTVVVVVVDDCASRLDYATAILVLDNKELLVEHRRAAREGRQDHLSPRGKDWVEAVK